MLTIQVKDANGDTQTIQSPNANGRAAAAGSAPVVLAQEDAEVLARVLSALGATLSVELSEVDRQHLSDLDDGLEELAGLLNAPALASGAATSAKQDAATAAIGKLGSATRFVPLVPGDSDLAVPVSAIYVGAAGELVLRGADNVDATLAVTAGQILPVSPLQVRASTTASGLVGLIA